MTIVKEPEDYRQIPFKKLYKMYEEDIEMDYSYRSICEIPKEWLPYNSIMKPKCFFITI